MASIAISELRPSYLAEMAEGELKNVVGGATLAEAGYPYGIGVPNMNTGVAFKPLSADFDTVVGALESAVDYAGADGLVWESLIGGSFSYIAYKVDFQPAPEPAEG